MRSRTRCFQAGFTLIELMTVITLMAVVLGLGVPSFRSFVLGQRVKSAAFAFANAAVQARSEAIKRNSDVALVAAGGGWAQGWTVQVVSGPVVLSRQEAYDGVVMASVAPKVTAATVTYQSSGRLGVAVNDLQVNDENGGHARCISFDLSGMPRSRMGNCS